MCFGLCKSRLDRILDVKDERKKINLLIKYSEEARLETNHFSIEVDVCELSFDVVKDKFVPPLVQYERQKRESRKGTLRIILVIVSIVIAALALYFQICE